MSYQEGIEAAAVALRTHRFGSGAWVPQADRDDTEIVVAAFLETAGTPARYCKVHREPFSLDWSETDIVGRAICPLGPPESEPCRIVSRLLVEPKEGPQ